MDFTRLTQGEKIAAVSGVALILIMLIFKWFGVEATGEFGALSATVDVDSRGAFGSYGFIDIVLVITVAAAIGLALISASQTEVGLPVAASAIVAGLGVLSVVLVVISILSPPEFLDVSGDGIDYTRKIGVWLGLIAAIGVAYGGWRAMQEEGTSFGEEANRLREPDEGPGAAPPPPPSSPPPSSPPPGGTP
jgi:hypothetical protein